MHHEPLQTLLVIDDDRLFCDSVAAFFKSAPFRVVTAQSGRQGLAWSEKNRVDVVLLDQKLPDINGLELCTPLLAANDQAKIIFITAYPSFEHAVNALRGGAHDYLSKPMELEELELAVTRAFRTVELEHVEQVQRYERERDSGRNVIGISGGLRGIWRLVERAATNRAPVLLTGETGTGKNVIAKAIHFLYQQHNEPFVGVNCAALPENLIEAELFGYEKGAFTGAETRKKGILELADSGTLFLDEIGELPLHLQAKLLGVLDDGSVRRLGSEKEHSVNLRIIAATNADLELAVGQRRFREDLYYRLSVIRIHLPQLRERQEDIAGLCATFLKRFAPDQDLTLSAEELDRLKGYPWPGNVRELKNVIERAVILRSSEQVQPGLLLSARPDGMNAPDGSWQQQDSEFQLQPLRTVEELHIRNVLAALDHNHTKAAQVLGISRSTLIRKLDQYGIRSGVLKQDTVLF